LTAGEALPTLSPRAVAQNAKTSIEIDVDAEGAPLGATGEAIVGATPERLWTFISDLERYPGMIPMIHRISRDGDRVRVHLRFKISLFSVGFDFVADVAYEDARWLEVRWVSGEPRNLRIRFDVEPFGDGQSRIRAGIWFDVFSLGWLAKYFLKHHPEIQNGIFPGCVVTLVESLRRAARS
jgi:carbon monoxide dehydrogenase subunit G